MNLMLIHGQGRTPLSMAWLGWRLRRQGYHVQYFGYFTFWETFDDIVHRFTRTIQAEIGSAPYAIVGHSLGTIVARAALPRLADHPPRHLIMLAPPNHPTQAAKRALDHRPYRWFTQDCGRKLASPAFYEQLPVPTIPTTIIAGTWGLPAKLSPFGHQPNDGVLTVAETELAGHQVLVAPAAHAFIMNAKDVVRVITEVVGIESPNL